MTTIDSFSKVLLATQTINFLASHINISRIEMGLIQDKTCLDISESHSDKLLSLVDQLRPIMESLGEYMNGKDMADDETIKATEGAFDLVNR